MSLFDLQSWIGKRNDSRLHPWDSAFRLLDLTGQSDFLTLGDCFTGIGVFGAAGSGKTSSLATIAHALMVMECRFVWLCAKPDEVQLVTRIAAKAGRSADLVVIGDDAGGQLSPHRFNPLAYESSVTTGTGSVVQYLSDCTKVLSHKEGTRRRRGNASGRINLSVCYVIASTRRSWRGGNSPLIYCGVSSSLRPRIRRNWKAMNGPLAVNAGAASPRPMNGANAARLPPKT